MNIMQLLQSGMNPRSVIQNFMNSNPEISQNPIAQNAMRMAQNKDIFGLKSMAQNLYRERGLDINQAYNQIFSMMNFDKQ